MFGDSKITRELCQSLQLLPSSGQSTARLSAGQLSRISSQTRNPKSQKASHEMGIPAKKSSTRVLLLSVE